MLSLSKNQIPPHLLKFFKPRHVLKPKDDAGIPWAVATALRDDGWILRSDCIWSKPNPMPESVKDRPTRAHEYVFLLSKSARYYYDADAVKEPSVYPDDDRKARAAASQKRMLTDGVNDIRPARYDKSGTYPTRNIRSVWTIATQPTSFAHFATFPEKLAETCIRSGSRQGDIVLDPFAGSGTTERVAIRLGRRFIGTELNYQYIHDIVPQRVRNVQIELV